MKYLKDVPKRSVLLPENVYFLVEKVAHEDGMSIEAFVTERLLIDMSEAYGEKEATDLFLKQEEFIGGSRKDGSDPNI